MIVADAACTGARLAEDIDALVAEPGRLDAMGAAAAALGRPDAVAAVVALARSHARTPPSRPRAARGL